MGITSATRHVGKHRSGPSYTDLHPPPLKRLCAADMADLVENEYISGEVINTVVDLFNPGNILMSSPHICLDAIFLNQIEALSNDDDRWHVATTVPSKGYPKTVIMPFCITSASGANGHWITVVLDIEDRLWTVYDSLSWINHPQHFNRVQNLVQQVLGWWVVPDLLPHWQYIASEVPQQDDGVNCGIYTIAFIIGMLEETTVYPQPHYVVNASALRQLFVRRLQGVKA